MPYRVFGTLGLLATTTVLGALVVAVDATSFHLLAPGSAGSRPWLLVAVAIAIGSVALATLIRGAAALAGLARREVRLSRRLDALPSVDVDDGPVLVVPGARLEAFCAGVLRPRVCVSDRALAELDRRELAAVVAHERHHALRRDPLRLAAVDVIAASLFFVPGLRELGAECRAAAELDADAAAEQAGGPPALAAAFLRFADEPTGGVAYERVDRLLGDPVSTRVSKDRVIPGVAATAALLALIVTVAVATGCADLDLAAAVTRPDLLLFGLAPLATGALMLIAAGSAANAVHRRRLA